MHLIWFIFKISIILFSSDWHLSADFYLRWKEFFKVYSLNFFTQHGNALELTKLVHFLFRSDFFVVEMIWISLVSWFSEEKFDTSLRQIYPYIYFNICVYFMILKKNPDIYNFFGNRVFELMLNNNNESI